MLRGAPYRFDAIGGVYDPVGLWCSVSTVVIGGVCGLGWLLNGLGVNQTVVLLRVRVVDD